MRWRAPPVCLCAGVTAHRHRSVSLVRATLCAGVALVDRENPSCGGSRWKGGGNVIPHLTPRPLLNQTRHRDDVSSHKLTRPYKEGKPCPYKASDEGTCPHTNGT